MKKTLLSVSICLVCTPVFSQWSSNGSVISTTQNVGIGTVSPTYKLDVSGDIRSKNLVVPAGFQVSASLSDKLTHQGQSFGHYSLGWIADSWSAEGHSLWQSGFAGIKLFTGGQSRLGITFSGNVGIGTDAPAYKLDVNGDVRSKNVVLPAGFQVSANLTDKFTYQGRNLGQYALGWMSDSWNAEGHTLWQSGFAGMKFFTGGQPRLGITFSGNVGIGTDAPEHLLDVNGDVRSANLALNPGGLVGSFLPSKFLYKERNMGHYAIGWMNDSWALQGATLWQSGFGGIKFFTGGHLQMSIHNTGNIGIGTEIPAHKLDVNGNIRGNHFYANGTVYANEVKVETTKWSDFVFDKDYKLLPLEEVKAHIEEHKHLPDVPSEKQVIEEGINVVEMQAKLLQKIEELTLYVIQQDTKNKELEQEIKKLKTSLSKD